ncbi:MAG TPA: hypothetical protein VEY95_15045 [Azospirillaceae bacterium]|nr:hypothetical protein [Azospirillaceae bacterium]
MIHARLGFLLLPLTLAACQTPDEGANSASSLAGPPAMETGGPASSRAIGMGPLLLHGGGASGERAFLRKLVELSGPDPRICTVRVTGSRPGYTTRSERIIVLDAAAAESIETAQQLADCTGLYIAPADPRRLAELLRPGGQDSPALSVLRQRRTAGAPIALIGTSANAAGPSELPEGASDSSAAALLQDRIPVAPGLALADGVLVDTHFFRKGLLGRHIRALAAAGVERGIGLDEAAMVLARPDGQWEVAGDQPVALVERPSGAPPDQTTGYRLSLLRAGDRFDPHTGSVTPGGGRTPAPMPPDSQRALARTEAFAPDALRQLAERLAQSPTDRAIARAEGGRVRVTLRKLEDTRVYAGAGGSTIIGLGVDVERVRRIPEGVIPASVPAAAQAAPAAAPSTPDTKRTAVAPPRKQNLSSGRK